MSGRQGVFSRISFSKNDQAHRPRPILQFQALLPYGVHMQAHSVRAAIPIDLVHVEDVTFLSKETAYENLTEEWWSLNRTYPGKSLYRLRSHIALFNGFRFGNHSHLRLYASWYRAIFQTRMLPEPDLKKDVIAYRSESFALFNELYNAGGIWNTGLAIDVRYDANTGRFIISDGHHRATFLLTAGSRWIVANMPAEDLHAFLNHDSAAKANAAIGAQRRTEVYSPIDHPLVTACKVYRDNGYPSRLSMIHDFLAYYTPETLLDIGSNLGFFSFHFAREQIDVVGVEKDFQHYELSLRLKDLFRSKCILLLGDINDHIEGLGQFEGCLLLTTLYHLMAQDIGAARRLIGALNERVAQFLVWESGSNPAAERALIVANSKFTRYTRLGNTYATGKYRELGIFYRPDSDLLSRCSQMPFPLGAGANEQ